MALDEDKKHDYLLELYKEKERLDSSFNHSIRLLSKEIARVEASDEFSPDNDVTTDDNASKENTSAAVAVRFFDPSSPDLIKLSERVLIPVKENPSFNFVGKLLGPRGNTFKRLQSETLTKMSILGKGSMRDKDKEEELRKNDPLSHLHLDLHVLVEAEAPYREAHQRLCSAIDALKKFLRPTNDGPIHLQQMRELAFLSGQQEDGSTGIRRAPPAAKPRPRPVIRPQSVRPTSGRGIRDPSLAYRAKSLTAPRRIRPSVAQATAPENYGQYAADKYDQYYDEGYSRYSPEYETSDQDPHGTYSYDASSRPHTNSHVEETDSYDDEWPQASLKMYANRSTKSYRQTAYPY